LPARGQRTESRVRQPDPRLPPEHRIGVLHRPRAGVETRFEREDRLRAATEVFRALEAETAAGPYTLVHPDGGLATAHRAKRRRIALVADPVLDDPVQRDAALRERRRDGRHRGTERQCQA